MYCIASTLSSHFAMRQSDCKNHSLFLSPLSRYFLLLFSSSYLLSENFVSEHIIILFHISSLLLLCHSLPCLSSLFSFRIPMHKILFLPFLLAAELAMTIPRRISRSWRLSRSLNSRASPPVKRLRKRTLHFFRHTYC